jgi:hypothetical protein
MYFLGKKFEIFQNIQLINSALSVKTIAAEAINAYE